MIGAVFWNYLSVVFSFIAETVSWERWEGTLEYTFMAPVRRYAQMLGSTVYAVAYALIQMLIILGAMIFFFDLEFTGGNYVTAGAFILLGSLSFVGVGMMAAILPLMYVERGDQMVFVIQSVLLLISGVYYSTDVLPEDAVHLAVLAGDLRARRGARRTHRWQAGDRAAAQRLAPGGDGRRAHPGRRQGLRDRGALREAHREAEAGRMTTSREVPLHADATGVPGLIIRGYRPRGEDIPEMVRVANAELAMDGSTERRTSGGPDRRVAPRVRALRSEPTFTSRKLTECSWRTGGWSGSIPPTACASTAPVAMSIRRGGGAASVAGCTVPACGAAARHRRRPRSTERPRFLGLWTNQQAAGALALAASEGFVPVRWFFEMERPGLDRDLPELPPMPDGLEVRPITPDKEWQLWLADTEAFQDHWGGFDASEAAFRRWVEGPHWQRELCVVAWDGDEIAGGVVNTIYAEENEALGVKRGRLDSVFTRRAWRKRGLARALIARSLHLLAAQGLDNAALGVDADNPSGALGLYESFGFRVMQRGQAWRRPLEDAS